MELVFATNNAYKLREAEEILGREIRVLSLRDIGCMDVLPENGITLRENAMEKAKYLHNKYNVDCFSDDTGLEVEALNGAPGVYSARYAGPEADAQANIRKLLYEMREKRNRKAVFRTIIALVTGGSTRFFEGSVGGIIVKAPKGGEGFGYDSIFQPDGYTCTFAEMAPAQKNSISHRFRALTALSSCLNLHARP